MNDKGSVIGGDVYHEIDFLLEVELPTSIVTDTYSRIRPNSKAVAYSIPLLHMNGSVQTTN